MSQGNLQVSSLVCLITPHTGFHQCICPGTAVLHTASASRQSITATAKDPVRADDAAVRQLQRPVECKSLAQESCVQLYDRLDAGRHSSDYSGVGHCAVRAGCDLCDFEITKMLCSWPRFDRVGPHLQQVRPGSGGVSWCRRRGHVGHNTKCAQQRRRRAVGTVATIEHSSVIRLHLSAVIA